MEMSSEIIDPIESAAKGATKGFLEFSEEKLKQLAQKFKDRDLAFIEDSETIDEAKEIRKQSEYSIFADVIKDKDKRTQFLMGLTLRKQEARRDDTAPLIQKIIKKYNQVGLHLAFLLKMDSSQSSMGI